MNTDSDWIKYGVGMVYMRKRRYQSAEDEFNELLAKNPSYGYAYAQLGYIRKYAGKKEESIVLFNKAIKHLPDEEMGIYQRGLMHVECEKFDDALDQFSKVLGLNPVYADAILNIGFVYGRKGDFEQAEKLLKVAYQKDANIKDGFARLGWIKTEAKEWFGAAEIMNRDYKEGRLSPGWQVNLAQVYGRTGEMDRAISLIEDAYSINTDLKDGYARLGWIKATVRDWEGAFDLMNRDMEMNRISPVWQVNLAQMLGRKGEWNRGIQLIKQAYASNLGLKDGYARLGWIKTEAQDWHDTISLMAEDRKQKRLSSGWQSNLARILVFNGEYDNALNIIEDLYLRNREATDGYAKVGWACFLSCGDEQTLRNLVEKDADLNRLSDLGIRIRAWENYVRGDLISAEILMESLYSEAPVLKDGFAVMGWLIIEKGDLKTGIILMEKDYQLQRLSPVWRINYAYQLAKAGQIQKAQGLFAEVIDLEPHREKFRIGHHLCPIETMTKSQFQKMMACPE